MAFDPEGPFKEGKDFVNKKKKCLLMAACTWLVLRATNKDAEDPDSLTFEGPLVAGNPYEDDDFEYASSVVTDNEGPMDKYSDEEAAIMGALHEMTADSVDYDVMDVFEVFPAKLKEVSGSGGKVDEDKAPLPVFGEMNSEDGDIAENLREAGKKLRRNAEAVRFPEVAATLWSADVGDNLDKGAMLVSEETLGLEEPKTWPGPDDELARFMKKEEYMVRTII